MTRDDRGLETTIVELTRVHGPRVYAVAQRYARTEDDVEDLMQEIWTRVIEVLPRKNPDSPMAGWLTMTAMNVGREWTRNRYRWSDFKGRALRFFHIELEDAPTTVPATGRGLAERRIIRAVDGLPELQRNVVILRIFEGMSTKETAEAIERSEGTVKASLSRGLQTLRGKLRDLEDLWARGDL
jgi:RNA polymerase sigma-70 factor (ECF subfamily)